MSDTSVLLQQAQDRMQSIIEDLEAATGRPITQIKFFIEHDGTRNIGLRLDASGGDHPLLDPTSFVGPGASQYLRSHG